MTGCTTPRSTPDPTEIRTIPQPSAWAPAGSQSTSGGGSGRVLLAYFSRAGENYFYGGRRDLEVGNTEVVASMIAELIDCDTYRIEARDPYPDGYDATVQRNVAEQDADARPGIRGEEAAQHRSDVGVAPEGGTPHHLTCTRAWRRGTTHTTT